MGSLESTDHETHDWESLTVAAIEAMQHAYAPYSRFKVGASARTNTGRTVTGCNVENASYGIGLCAECGLISDLVRNGGGKLTAIVCVDQHGQSLMPCGRCRQLLWEHSTGATLIMTPLGVKSLSDMLPQAFGPEDLVARAEVKPHD